MDGRAPKSIDGCTAVKVPAPQTRLQGSQITLRRIHWSLNQESIDAPLIFKRFGGFYQYSVL